MVELRRLRRRASRPPLPRAVPVALLVATYAVLAVVVTWPQWQDPVHTFLGPGGDNQLTLSFFALTQHAVATWTNPFFTTFINAPDGVNLAWQTTSPLLAMLVWPIDVLWGPVAGYDVALTAALALNGIVATLVFRRVVGGWAGPLAGGLLWAASPFVLSHARGHLELAVLVTPPLLLWVFDRILHTHRDAWLRNGLLLSAIVVAQFYISVEVTIIEAIAVTVGLVVLAALHPRQVRGLLPKVAATGGLALAVSGAAVVYPLVVFFTYPLRPAGPVQQAGVFETDAANLVVPNQFMLIAPFRGLSSTFSGGVGEATAYLGIPLVLLLGVILVWQRRNRVVWAAAITLVVLGVLSLGGHLHAGGTVTRVPLPWLPLSQLPVLDNVLPVRISLVMLLLAALLVALGVSRVRGRAGTVVATSLLSLTVVSWLPALPWQSSSPPVPSFFTGDAARIPANSTVLVAPLPFTQQANAQLWQAWAGTRFRIVGGYFNGPQYRAPRTLPRLSAALLTIEDGNTPLPVDVTRFRAELAGTGIATVVLGPSPEQAGLDGLLRQVCGGDPEQDEGVEVWWTCAR